ncbi:ABC transporter permease [Frisingicoccus sp.]|uniref:ABC transporter permease n=1 Tax=Frisingicoccus sp. TaxID=1918627 RepID=UPI003AB7F2CE
MREKSIGKKKLFRFFKDRSLAIGAGIIIIYAVLVCIVPFFLKGESQNLANALHRPDREFLFGADEAGRGLFRRVLEGGRIDLMIAVCGVSFAYILALPFGLCAGYVGGNVDRVISVVSESILTFPSMVLSIFVVTIFGSSFWGLVFTIAVTQAPQLIRYIRGFVMQVKNLEYIEAGKAVGSTTYFILTRHIIRNITGNTAVILSLMASEALLVASALGFLGLGVQPPTAELGTMLSRGRMYFDMAPHLMIFPGLFIAILILGFNLLGDGIRNRLDSKKT